MAALVKLHSQRLSAVQTSRRVLGSEHPGVAALSFDRRQIEGPEWPRGSQATAHVAVEDTPAGLQALGKPPERERERERQQPLRVQSPNENDGGVQAEMADRRAFLERMQRERHAA